MKKIILCITLIISVFLISGCTKEDVSASKFKEEYESLNGVDNYRSVSISDDNPFVYITTDELIEKLENNETFYVYFGSKSCPWCRSVVETAIQVANENNIDTIYYIDIWDDDKNEILRDKYMINDDNELEQITQGTDNYYKLLEYFDSVLSDYTLTDNDGDSISVGEKRIYAPNYIYVEDGVATKLVTGISELQTTSNDELTDEIIDDMTTIFSDFFTD